MTIHPDVVGIDVSRDRLDIFDGQALACANTSDAIAPLAEVWSQRGAFVVLEATGAYDRTLRRALAQAGVRFARVNPGRARDYARAAGFLAKTDQVDARMLAELGQRLQPRPAEPEAPGRERLTALHRRRDQLVLTRQQERTRRKGPTDPEIAESLERHLDWLDGEIAELDRRIAACLAAEPELAAAGRLLTTIPGVGPVTAATLLALVPELGRRPGKSIAALAGLAPLNRDSGLSRGKRTIGGGRKRVRDGLYMAAVAATRSHSRLAADYRRLRDLGKPPKLAIIAIARKLITIANAVLRDQKPYAA